MGSKSPFFRWRLDHCRKTIWNGNPGRVFPVCSIISTTTNDYTGTTRPSRHNNNCRERNNSTLISFFLKIKPPPPAPVGISARISGSQDASAAAADLCDREVKKEKRNTIRKKETLVDFFLFFFSFLFSNEKIKCK